MVGTAEVSTVGTAEVSHGAGQCWCLLGQEQGNQHSSSPAAPTATAVTPGCHLCCPHAPPAAGTHQDLSWGPAPPRGPSSSFRPPSPPGPSWGTALTSIKSVSASAGNLISTDFIFVFAQEIPTTQHQTQHLPIPAGPRQECTENERCSAARVCTWPNPPAAALVIIYYFVSVT